MPTLHHTHGGPSAGEPGAGEPNLVDPEPAHPSADEIREHLDTILASDEFCSSRRSSELLRHLVERALAGDADSLKERLLGVEIFHRRSDYDTSSDAIVRVTANDVRRRLTNFYTDHPGQPMRISLPLGSYIPDFIQLAPHDISLRGEGLEHAAAPVAQLLTPATELEVPASPLRSSLHKPLLWMSIALAFAGGWWIHGLTHPRGPTIDPRYTMYDDLLGPIGVRGKDDTEIALTNPHVLLYLGLKQPGPPLGATLNDIPVPPDMAAVLNRTANDTQADFPYHHFFVDTTNYTGFGEATAAYGLARLLEATGRSAHLTGERFLNWDAARQEQLVILGAPHESAFVQSTLSAANFTIGYDSIHNAHPLPGEQSEYTKSHNGGDLEDYGLIWMTTSPSGTRVLVLAGLSSAGTAGVGEFFGDPQQMLPVYNRLRAAAKNGVFPQSWQVLLRIDARDYVPIRVTPVAIRITPN